MPRYSFALRDSAHTGPMSARTNTHVNQSRTQKYRKPAIDYSYDADSPARHAQRALLRCRRRESFIDPALAAIKAALDSMSGQVKLSVSSRKPREVRRRRRTAAPTARPYSSMDIDMDEAPCPSVPRPSLVDGDVRSTYESTAELLANPYSREAFSKFLRSPTPSRARSVSVSSVHGSSQASPRPAHRLNDISQHADEPSRPLLPSFIVTPSTSSAQLAARPEEARLAPAEPQETRASVIVIADDDDDDDDGSYHPEEGDDEDNTSELSSAPPSPGIPAAARELERWYLEDEALRSAIEPPQRASTPSPHAVSAQSDMSFTHDPLPSPAPPPSSSSSSATSLRPTIRIETSEQALHAALHPAPFTAYPLEPPSMLGVNAASGQDSRTPGLGLSMNPGGAGSWDPNAPYPYQTFSQAAVNAFGYPEASSSSSVAHPSPQGHSFSNTALHQHAPAPHIDPTPAAVLDARRREMTAMMSSLQSKMAFIGGAAQMGAHVSSDVLDTTVNTETVQFPRLNGAMDRAVLDFRKRLAEFNSLAYQYLTGDLSMFLAPRQR